MSHDDSSGGAGSPLTTQPNTGWDGRANEQTDEPCSARYMHYSVNALYPESKESGRNGNANIPPLQGRRRAGIAIQTHVEWRYRIITGT